jgi:signal transduction protein with GAF and PtsI domain
MYNQEVYQQISQMVQNVTNMLGADRSSLFLLDPEKNQLVATVAQGMENTELRLDIGEGVAGKCAQTGQILNINNADYNQHVEKGVDKYTGYHTETILCVPIRKIGAGDIVGVIEVLNKQSGPFTQQDETVLTSLSIMISNLIDRLFIPHYSEYN